MPAPFLLSIHRAAQHHLAVDGGQLAYLDLGPRDGHPVLLLHGIPTSSWLYRDVAARLAAAGLRAIAPDLLGYGASDKPAEHSLYTPRRQAERIVALLNHLGLARVTMAVHDLGGPVGFEIAETSPTRIAGLVVLNTTAYADAFRPPLQLRMLGGPLGTPMLAMMASRAGRPMVHDMLAGYTHIGRAIDRTVTEGYWRSLQEGTTRALRAQFLDLDAFLAGMSRHAAALRRLDVPATVIWGTADTVLRHERLVHRFVTDLNIRPEDVHLLPDAGHFLQEDRPADIADLVAKFVRTSAAAR